MNMLIFEFTIILKYFSKILQSAFIVCKSLKKIRKERTRSHLPYSLMYNMEKKNSDVIDILYCIFYIQTFFRFI